MTTLTAKGQDLTEFLEFFEIENQKGNFTDIEHEEETQKAMKYWMQACFPYYYQEVLF